MAVVREAGIDGEHRDVALTVGQPLDGYSQAQPEKVLGDRFARRSSELSREMER